MDADEDILLPAHLRVPDLSTVRAVTPAQLRTWVHTAGKAVDWGPQSRNRCRRRPVGLGGDWTNEHGQLHSPDPYTPTFASISGGQSFSHGVGAHWFAHGAGHRPGDQPAEITGSGLTWWTNGEVHREHAPAELSATDAPAWFWRGISAPGALTDLLNRAWTDQTITDAAARHLLDQAADLAPDLPHLPVRPDTWIEHVLARNPTPNLSATLRSWLTLATC